MSKALLDPINGTNSCSGRVRCAVYARYSSDKQRKASIDDQIRNCREAAIRKGWLVLDEMIFSDGERSGTTIHGREGLSEMMRQAKLNPKPFEYILIDDTSRLGRNKADVFKQVDILNFYGVRLYFVEDELDSAQSWFENAFHEKAQRDQEYSKSLGKKVQRGRRGRFLAGFNPGGYCYGYVNVPVEDPTKKGDYGRPLVIGVMQQIVPEEAAVLVRIFEAFDAGMSLMDIASMLNREGVPTSQTSRGGKRNAYWCKTAIKEMLRNTRYVGKPVYGRRKQVRDPETGRMRTTMNPKSEWEYGDQPELRIIDDDLFARVQETFRIRSNNLGVKRLGGMCRTEAAEKYLFSGLLRCGACGGNLCIVMSKPEPRYGCSRYRGSKTCPNRRTVALGALETAFLAALSANLRSTVVLDDLAAAVLKRVKELRRADRGKNRTKEGYEASLRVLEAQIANVLAAIKEAGHRRSLLAELEELETEQDRLEQGLAALANEGSSREVTEVEVRQFLVARMRSLDELLITKPLELKAELRKLVSHLTLTPIGESGHRSFVVTGDVGLFSATESTLQSCSVDPIALQCTFAIAFTLKKGAYSNHARVAVSESVDEGQAGEGEAGDEAVLAGGILDLQIQAAC